MAKTMFHVKRDHPRIRGEHSTMSKCTPAATGSSPHTRGAPRRPRQGHRRGRIIPAYAGSTLRGDHPIRQPWDHPRIRGEHAPAPPGAGAGLGSSPHTRGAPRGVAGIPVDPRIIPAYAGSTRAPGNGE